MKHWRVTIGGSVPFDGIVVVEAETEEEAREMAREEFKYDFESGEIHTEPDWEYAEWDIDEVEEMTEEHDE